MATNHPQAAMLTRYELITLHTVLNARHSDVVSAANNNHSRMLACADDSDEQRWFRALCQADLRYANDLSAMAKTLDRLLDTTTCDNFRLQGE